MDHGGIIEELGLAEAALPGPGIARFAFPTLGELYSVLPHVYRLSTSLPEAPLQAFLAKTQKLPQTTEAERLVVQRIGQDIFRARLIDYWRRDVPKCLRAK